MNSQLIDRSKLDDFTKDDPELLADLAVIFVRFVPNSLANIKHAIDNNENVLLRENAHQLKSQLSYFFCDSLVENAQSLEEYGRNANMKDAKKLVDRICDDIESLIAEINELTSLDLNIDSE